MSAPTEGTPVVKQRRGWHVWAGWATVGVLVLLAGATAYVGTIAAAWTSHEAALSEDVANLKSQVELAGVDVATLKTGEAEAHKSVTTSLLSISVSVDAKADAQDYQDLYTDAALALNKCAKERETQIGYVRQASRYTASSLAAYENSVNSFCAKVSKGLAKLIKEEVEDD